jgi:dolichol-phosphate mannosyltransferase
MKIKETQLSVIVPTRNESANINALIDALEESLAGIATEVIIVDDSDDETPHLVEQLMQTSEHLQIHLLHRNPGLDRIGGLATAVSLGMKSAHAKYMAVIDADLQHPPERLRALYEAAIAEDADVVMATRYRAGGSYDGLEGFSRRFISIGLKWVAKLVFPDQLLRVSDPLGGFFLVRRSIVENVTLRPIGYKISLELLVRCSWARLVEVPYQFNARQAGQSKADIKQGLLVFQHMGRLIWEVPGAARFWKFCCVGASGVVLNLILFWIALHLGLSHWTAWATVTETTIITNFFLNSLLTWGDQTIQNQDEWLHRLARYHGAVVPSIAVNFVVFVIGILYGHAPLVAQTLGVSAGVIFSYLLARRVVFTSDLPNSHVRQQVHIYKPTYVIEDPSSSFVGKSL